MKWVWLCFSGYLLSFVYESSICLSICAVYKSRTAICLDQIGCATVVGQLWAGESLPSCTVAQWSKLIGSNAAIGGFWQISWLAAKTVRNSVRVCHDKHNFN